MASIGFHTAGSGGNPSGIGDYVRAMATANRPAMIVCADGMVGIGDALATGKPHHLLYRVVRDGSEWYAVPNYSLSPLAAAVDYYDRLTPLIPPEVQANKDKIWIILGNELDKGRADWIGRWGMESAQIWNASGYKVAMFGWSSGEPEPEHWQLPGMALFLRYAAARPDRVAVALHEYSYNATSLSAGSPWLVGRFLELFRACDAMQIDRPTVFITEFGWTHTGVLEPDQALPQIAWAQTLYRQHPQIKGAAIWYLGPGFANIANQAQRLISPVTTWQVSLPPPAPPPLPPPAPPPAIDDGLPRVQYARTYYLPHPRLPTDKRQAVYNLAARDGRTVGPSADDAGLGALQDKTAVLFGYPEDEQQVMLAWYRQHYPGTKIEFRNV